MTAKPLHIALLAGETSGDLLGAPLLAALRERLPNARFSGVGGAAMQAAGLDSLIDMNRLAVMGLVEVLRHLPDILADMQAHTNPGGYNLIVAAMNTADYPCQMPFSFTFREGELRDYYAGWEFITYEEAPGNMHATDAQGNPIRLKFVTMLARKPE